MEWNFDRVIAIAGIVLAVLVIGMGLGMDTKTEGEFRFVQGCFSLSALVLFVTMIIWAIQSNAHLLKQCIFVAVISALIGLSFLEGPVMVLQGGPRTVTDHRQKHLLSDLPWE